MDDKIATVAEFSRPKLVDDIRQFLSLASHYRCFIKGYAARSLDTASKEGRSLSLGQRPRKHCQRLETYTHAHAPILTFSNFKDPFLQTDPRMSNIAARLTYMDNTGKKARYSLWQWGSAGNNKKKKVIYTSRDPRACLGIATVIVQQ